MSNYPAASTSALPARVRTLFKHHLVFIGRRTLDGVRAAGYPTIAHWVRVFEKTPPTAEETTKFLADYQAAETKEAERGVMSALRGAQVSPETRADLVATARCTISLTLGRRVAKYPYSRDEVLSRFMHGLMRRATLRQLRREIRLSVLAQMERRRKKPLVPVPPVSRPTGDEATRINNGIEQMISRARKSARHPNCSPIQARHMVLHVAALESWRVRVLAGHQE
jgi:hypothetical protein